MLALDKQYREHEIEALRKRWWNYRGEHPVKMTYLFAAMYRQHCVDWHCRYVDEQTPERAKSFVPEDIFKSRDKSAMWMARQHTDLAGIPYDFLFAFALQKALNSTYRHPVRPNQLYSEEFQIDLHAAWAQRRRESLQMASNPIYRVEAWRGYPWQREYLAYLQREIAARPQPHHRILGRLMAEGWISPEWVELHWGAAVSRQAADTARMLAGAS